jgi:hypothetical protein
MMNITSPSASDNLIEQEIQAKGKTAPNVTPADVEANIAHGFFFTAKEAADGLFDRVYNQQGLVEAPDSLKLLTFCVITLKNGFVVTGESACASPENFDEKISRKIARENAINKIWPLMEYKLKSCLPQ